MLRSLSIVAVCSIAMTLMAESSVASLEDDRTPGLDPATVRVVADDDTRARLPLTEALGELAGRRSLPAPVPFDPGRPTDAEKDQAATHYIKGRDAMAQDRFYVAIIEFDRGLKLHPGSPSLLRQQARCYGIMGNNDRSNELYERLRAVEPNDAEALLMFANARAAKGDFNTAASALSRLGAQDDPMAFDPGANIVASQILAFSLADMGYDQAALAAAQAVLDMPERLSGPSIFEGRVNAIAQQKEELRRVAGDAHLRLGRPHEALEYYRAAAEGLVADRNALMARIAVASARAEEPQLAQRAIREAVESIPTPEVVDPWLIEFASSLQQHRYPVDELRSLASNRANADSDRPQYVRLLAATLPVDEAVEALRAYLDQHAGQDERLLDDVRGDLLTRLARADENEALGEAAALVAREAGSVEGVERNLFKALGASIETVSSLRAMDSLPASLLAAHQQLRLGDLGAAARIADALVADHPDEEAVLSLALTVAGRLGEPARVNHASLLAARIDSADLACDESEARLLTDDVPGAIRAAERATQLTPQQVRPWFALGQALSRSPVEVGRAAELLNRAREIDPNDPRPYIALLRLFDQRGPLADADRLRETLRELVIHVPFAPYVEGLRVQELLGNNRRSEAIERLLRLIDRAPTDPDALSTLIRTWLEQNRGDDALAWLDQRIAERPHDMTLVEQRVRVLMRLNRAQEAYAWLKAESDTHPDEYSRRRLLETVCYATERRDEAIRLAEQRLLSRPEGLRRDLDLIELYIVHDRTEEAAKRLRPMLERFADSPDAIIARILQLVEALPTIDPAYDDLRLRFVDRYLSRNATPDPRVYLMGLRSILRLERLGERFDAMAVALIALSVENAGPAGVNAIRTIRDCVQAFLSSREPEAAARVAELAMRSPRNWSRDAMGVLVQITLASHIAADQLDAAYDMLDELQQSGRLALVMNTEGGGDRLGAAYYSLSVLCTVVGREEAAERLLVSALERRPNDAMSMNNLGYRRVEEGVNTPENAAMIERAIELMPNNSNLLDTAGWLRYRQGRFAAEGDSGPGAAELLEQALREELRAGESPSAEVWDHLGDARWRLGSTEGAKEAWSRALRLLEDPAERERELQNFARYQMLGWGVLIEDPQAIYDREFAPRLDTVRLKLEAIERGERPPVVPTFAEAEGN